MAIDDEQFDISAIQGMREEFFKVLEEVKDFLKSSHLVYPHDWEKQKEKLYERVRTAFLLEEETKKRGLKQN